MNVVIKLRNALLLKETRHWDRIYVLIDIHDTIFKSTYDVVEKYDWMPYAKEALQLMSSRNDICIILWSSSYENKLNDYVEHLKDHGINVDFVNENPLEKNSILSDFSKKFYFNVGIDDKFGFNPYEEWEEIYDYLKSTIYD